MLGKDVDLMRVELIENGRMRMSTNHGVRKDNELIWYDNLHVMSMKFDDEMVQITINRMPNPGGAVR